MTERVLGPTGSPRRRWGLLVPVLLALAVGLAIGVPAAIGSHAEVSLPGSNFEIDTNANLKVDDPAPSIDWASVAETRKADAPTGSGDDSFGQGTKEDTAVPSVVDGSIPPNKSDLLNFGVYLETTATGARFLNLFWHRVQEPSGTTNMDFEFNQSSTTSSNGVTPVRTEGDLLIQYDLAQGGTNPILFLSEWVTTGASSQCEASNSVPCWSTKSNLSAAGDATGSINTSAIPAAESDGLGAVSARTFGEAQLDFDALTGGATGCTSFGSAYLKSRSSDSFTAALKDFIAPTATNLSNCGTIIIRKQTNPDGASGSFSYSTTGALTPSTFNLSDNGVRTYSNVLAGSYSVTEGDPSPTFLLQSINCSASTLTNGSTVTPNLAGRSVSITLAANDTIDCTFTNQLQAGALKILKKSTKTGNPLVSQAGAVFGVDGSDANTDPDFSVTDDTTAAAPDEDALVGSVCVSGLTPGAYTVTETSPPPGYGAGTPASASVTVVAGTNCSNNLPAAGATATFTNPPLYDLQVNFNDDGSGETSATISCPALEPADANDSTTPPAGWDTSKTFNNENAPETVICTITVDP